MDSDLEGSIPIEVMAVSSKSAKIDKSVVVANPKMATKVEGRDVDLQQNLIGLGCKFLRYCPRPLALRRRL